MRSIKFGLIGALALQAQSIRLERSLCFGVCPVYSIQIDAPGQVVYEGKEFVATTGVRKSKIREDQFRELVQQFHHFRFFQFLPEYTAPISDMPTTTVTFSEHGHIKAVIDYYNAPPELKELEREIERTVNSHQWLHNKQARFTLSTPAAGGGFALLTLEELKRYGTARGDAHSWIKPGVSALMHAVSLGKLDAARELLNTHPDLEAADETGWTALMVVSSTGFVDQVRLLLDAGAKPNQKDFHGDTALIAAAAVGVAQRGPEILTLLLAHGARVDETNDLGETALMWASWDGNPEAIDILLKHGANRKKTDRAGHNARFYLAQSSKLMGYDKDRQAKYDRAAVVLGQAVK